MSDNVVLLTPWHAKWLHSGSQLKRDILNAPNPPALVQAMTPLELLAVTHEIGHEDAHELLAMASPEQIKSLFSAAAWGQDTPVWAPLDRALFAALNQGQGEATQLFLKLDEEMQTLYLARALLIEETSEDELVSQIGEQESFATPDSNFIIALRPDEERQSPEDSAALSLVRDIYNSNWQLANQMLRDARWVIYSELEETLHDLREARLDEMGFPSLETAMKLHSRAELSTLLSDKRPLHTAPVNERTSTLPALYAEPFLADTFVTRVLLHFQQEPEMWAALEAELIHLVNGYSRVRHGEVGDMEAARNAAAQTCGLLSLGLEMASKGLVPEAVQSVKAHPLRVFYRLAVNYIAKLGDWARKAHQEGLFQLPPREALLLDADDTAFVKGLLAKFPNHCENALAAPRAFGSVQEVEKARQRLERLVARVALVKWLLAAQCTQWETLLPSALPNTDAIDDEELLRTLLILRTLQPQPHEAFAPLASLSVSRAQAAAFQVRIQSNSELPAWPVPAPLTVALRASWQTLTQDFLAITVAEPRFLKIITGKESA